MTDGPACQGEGVTRPHGFSKQEKVRLRRQNTKKYNIKLQIQIQNTKSEGVILPHSFNKQEKVQLRRQNTKNTT